MSGPRAGRFALAVDLGTGGPKVGLVSLTGAIAWSEHVPVSTRLSGGGGATQDAADWWEKILGAARRGISSGAVSPDDVVAVSCTGQWASTVPVDEHGLPVGDCVMWMDTRGGAHTRAALGGPVSGYSPVALWRWVRRSGGAPSTSGADPIGHILFLEHDVPEVAQAARWYLEPVDYLSMRFTGRAAASHASMTAAWLTDNRRPELLAYDPTLVRAAGVPVDKLPPLVATNSVVGTLLPEVAAALGLSPSVEVVAGTPDLHSAAAGSGAVGDYECHMVISTTSWISCPVPMKKTDAVHQIASVPGISPGRYLVADNHETGGLCLQWLRDNIVAPRDGVTGAGIPSFDAMTTLAASVPAGSGDVLFTPWLAGERSPVDDRNARGGFHNLSLHTTRAHLVRAVLEGVAYNSRWLHEAVERFVRRRLEPLRTIGGGAVSDLWCQIHADVMGRTVERVVQPLHANLRGAALLAGLALGEFDADHVSGLVPVDARFEPRPSEQAVYERLYKEFPGLYRSQKPMFARLNRPTAKAPRPPTS
ncbi:MAG TPA: FGGY-family carbohydrate kinase [Acidimicrobiales bacterium]|nr:FGGY-family carbohydrate kinase [Acidimicrobiales bacterium]